MCVLVKYNSCICTGKTQDNKNRLKDDAFVYNKERYARAFILLGQIVRIVWAHRFSYLRKLF